jgi:hypothetical protein
MTTTTTKAPATSNSFKPALGGGAKTSALVHIAEQIKLHCEIFDLPENDIKHLKRSFFYAEIQGGLVPEAFKGKVYEIFVMSKLADSMNCDLIEVLQGGYFVHGRFGWYAEFLIRRALSTGDYSLIDYETAGTIKEGSLTIRAFGVRADGTKVYGTAVSLSMAKAEGWTRNPKYGTMPALMLKKRAASFLIRETVPHIMGGHTRTAEELEDIATTAQRGTVVDTENQLAAMAALLGEAEQSEEELTVTEETSPEPVPAPPEPVEDTPAAALEHARSILNKDDFKQPRK